MNSLNERMLARLENRYLDPDYDGSIWSGDKDEAEFNRADEEYSERSYERRNDNGRSIQRCG